MGRNFGNHPSNAFILQSRKLRPSDTINFLSLTTSPVAEGVPNSDFSAYCWSQMSVCVCSLIWWALWNMGSSRCLWMLFLLFFSLWWKSWFGRARNLQSSVFSLVSGPCPAPPASSCRWEEGEGLGQQVVAWCHGKDLGEASPAARSCGECRSVLGRQDPTAELLRDSGGGTSPCQSITFASVTGSPLARHSSLPSLLQPRCPAGFW